ncbi:hypothetical protein WCP94_000875 [Bilophila wadsworthia]
MEAIQPSRFFLNKDAAFCVFSLSAPILFISPFLQKCRICIRFVGHNHLKSVETS